jgi:hypothetical protein
MSLERSILSKLDGLTPEERRLHIDWCLAIGMVEAATYHYRLLLPMDFPPGESEALYQRIRALKESGWNYSVARSQGELPPNPILERRRKQQSAERHL